MSAVTPVTVAARVVLCSAPDLVVARQLSRTLVEERLAACVNIVPGVISVYRWEGAIADEAEVLMVIKTQAERVTALTSRLCEIHPYDVPEVVALEVASGASAYLDWVRSETD